MQPPSSPGWSFFLPLTTLIVSLVCASAALPALLDTPAANSRSTAVYSPWSAPSLIQIDWMLNLPISLGDALINPPNVTPGGWRANLPTLNDRLFFWRAVSWSLVALPFWWIGGRAIDSIRSPPARLRIRRLEVILMCPPGLFGGLIGVMMAFTGDPGRGRNWIAIPAALWLVLFLLTAAAYGRSWVANSQTRVVK